MATDYLPALQTALSEIDKLVEARTRLTEQRDELAAALDALVSAHDGPWDGQEQRGYIDLGLFAARAALAKLQS